MMVNNKALSHTEVQKVVSIFLFEEKSFPSPATDKLREMADSGEPCAQEKIKPRDSNPYVPRQIKFITFRDEKKLKELIQLYKKNQDDPGLETSSCSLELQKEIETLKNKANAKNIESQTILHFYYSLVAKLESNSMKRWQAIRNAAHWGALDPLYNFYLEQQVSKSTPSDWREYFSQQMSALPTPKAVTFHPDNNPLLLSSPEILRSSRRASSSENLASGSSGSSGSSEVIEPIKTSYQRMVRQLEVKPKAKWPPRAVVRPSERLVRRTASVVGTACFSSHLKRM